jgi:hypothetical protein
MCSDFAERCKIKGTMRLRIASKRTNGGSVLLAAELSKPVADKHSSDFKEPFFRSEKALLLSAQYDPPIDGGAYCPHTLYVIDDLVTVLGLPTSGQAYPNRHIQLLQRPLSSGLRARHPAALMPAAMTARLVSPLAARNLQSKESAHSGETRRSAFFYPLSRRLHSL